MWQEKQRAGKAKEQEKQKTGTNSILPLIRAGFAFPLLLFPPFLFFSFPATCPVTSVTFYPRPFRTKLYLCPLSQESAASFALSASNRKRVAIAKNSVCTASRNSRCASAPTACSIAKPAAKRATTKWRTDEKAIVVPCPSVRPNIII